MATDYYMPQQYRFDLVLAKSTDGGGDREELLKTVGEHE